MSISALLDIPTAPDFVKALIKLLDEYDALAGGRDEVAGNGGGGAVKMVSRVRIRTFPRWGRGSRVETQARVVPSLPCSFDTALFSRSFSLREVAEKRTDSRNVLIRSRRLGSFQKNMFKGAGKNGKRPSGSAGMEFATGLGGSGESGESSYLIAPNQVSSSHADFYLPLILTRLSL